MYDIDEKNNITCWTCGDKIVTIKSHKPFCKGFSRKPWTVLNMTKERVEYWKNAPGFAKWAESNRIRFST